MGSIDLVEVGDAVAEFGVGVIVEVAAFADHLHDLRGSVLGHGLPEAGTESGSDRCGQTGAVGIREHVVRVVTGGLHAHGGDVGFHTAVIRGTVRRKFGDGAVGSAGTHTEDVEGISRTVDVVELTISVIACCHTDDYTLLSENGGAARGDAVYTIHVCVGDVGLREIREHAVA